MYRSVCVCVCVCVCTHQLTNVYTPRVLGVMALSRDASEPFTVLDELRLEHFCHIFGLCLVHHLRVARAEERRSKAQVFVCVCVCRVCAMPQWSCATSRAYADVF